MDPVMRRSTLDVRVLEGNRFAYYTYSGLLHAYIQRLKPDGLNVLEDSSSHAPVHKDTLRIYSSISQADPSLDDTAILQEMQSWPRIKAVVDAHTKTPDENLETYIQYSQASCETFLRLDDFQNNPTRGKPIVKFVLQKLANQGKVWGKHFFKGTFIEECANKGKDYRKILKLLPRDTRPWIEVNQFLTLTHDESNVLASKLVAALAPPGMSGSQFKEKMAPVVDKLLISRGATRLAHLVENSTVLTDALVSGCLYVGWHDILSGA